MLPNSVSVPPALLSACSITFNTRKKAEDEIVGFVDTHGLTKLHSLVNCEGVSVFNRPKKHEIMVVMAMLSLSLVHKITPDDFTALLRSVALA